MTGKNQSGLLLPTAMLLAMFSLMAATIVMARSKQSLGLTQMSERHQQQHLTARAELNRLLAELSLGASLDELSEEVREVVSAEGTSRRSWIVPDPDNANILHLHAQVWRTDVGPPGVRTTKLVRVGERKLQVDYTMTTPFNTGEFQEIFRREGGGDWQVVPPSTTDEPDRWESYTSYAADDTGALYVVEKTHDQVGPNIYSSDGPQFRFRRFDPATESWTTLALPGQGPPDHIRYHSEKVVGITASATGGSGVSVYDVASDSWSDLPTPPQLLYDDQGNLNPPGGHVSLPTLGTDVDMDDSGNIYFRAIQYPVDFLRDLAFPGYKSFTTIYKWDGQDWRALPPPPDSVPDFEWTPKNLLKSRLTATVDEGIALTWGHVNDATVWEFDGESWSGSAGPKNGDFVGPTMETALDPSADVLAIQTVNANHKGKIYLGTEFNTVSLEESSYSLVDRPPTELPTEQGFLTFERGLAGIASGTRTPEGESSYETLVSF